MAALHCVLWDFIIFAGMKPRLSIILAFFFVAACNHPVKVVEPAETPSSELAAIDSLMWHQPDSAFALLQEFAASPTANSLNVFNGHYCQLLISELLYKNDCEQSNRTELLQAVAYFDSLAGTHDVSLQPDSCRDASHVSAKNAPNKAVAFLDARAHYINGVGYYENDSVVEACKEYLKALEVMEEHFGEKELVGQKAQFMALLYTRLASLFSDQYLHEQVFYFGKNALNYYSKYDASTLHIAWMIDVIGLHYDILDNYDSAGYYYNQGLSVLSDPNSIAYRDITTHLTFLLYKKGEDAKTSLSQMYMLLAQAESNYEYVSRCLTIGEIFYHEQRFDSARHYLKEVYEHSITVNPKKQAAEWLVEICKAQGRNDEVSDFATFLVPFANQEENQSATKSKLTELFNGLIQTQIEKLHQEKVKKHTKQAVRTISGLLLIMLVIIILYHRNKCRKQDLETQIEAERIAHQVQQAALAGRLKRSNAALKEQDKMKSSVVLSSCPQRQNGAENYAEEPICQSILTICNNKSNPIKSTLPVSAYADMALTDAQKAKLKDAAMRHYGLLFEKLKQQHPDLKEKDFLYCYLCLLGLDNVQISVMMQLSYRTVWEREKRLQHLFQKEGSIAIILHEMMMD